MASNKAPIAPTAAASVGVAYPSTMEPRTAAISTSGGAKPLVSATTSGPESVSARAAGADLVQQHQDETWNECARKKVADRHRFGSKYALTYLGLLIGV